MTDHPEDALTDVISLLTNLRDKVARPNLNAQTNSQGDPMSKRDEAVEAGARAILHGATIDSFYVQGDWEAAGYDVQQSMLKASRDALDAALTILNPTAPHLEDQ